MQKAINETKRRRDKQQKYNEENGITPETIQKNIVQGIEAEAQAHQKANEAIGQGDDELFITQEYINELEQEMLEASDRLEFERAAVLRDRIEVMKKNIGKNANDKMFDFSRKKRKQRR